MRSCRNALSALLPGWIGPDGAGTAPHAWRCRRRREPQRPLTVSCLTCLRTPVCSSAEVVVLVVLAEAEEEEEEAISPAMMVSTSRLRWPNVEKRCSLCGWFIPQRNAAGVRQGEARVTQGGRVRWRPAAPSLHPSGPALPVTLGACSSCTKPTTRSHHARLAEPQSRGGALPTLPPAACAPCVKRGRPMGRAQQAPCAPYLHHGAGQGQVGRLALLLEPSVLQGLLRAGPHARVAAQQLLQEAPRRRRQRLQLLRAVQPAACAGQRSASPHNE